jgi:hypothetical protein
MSADSDMSSPETTLAPAAAEFAQFAEANAAKGVETWDDKRKGKPVGKYDGAVPLALERLQGT